MIIGQPFQVFESSNIPNFHHSSAYSLLRLHLLLQLLELLFGTLELSLLCGQLLLEILFLLLSLLNLVADQGAADQAYGSAYAGAHARMPGGAADDGAQTCAGTSPDDRALLRRG